MTKRISSHTRTVDGLVPGAKGDFSDGFNGIHTGSPTFQNFALNLTSGSQCSVRNIEFTAGSLIGSESVQFYTDSFTSGNELTGSLMVSTLKNKIVLREKNLSSGSVIARVESTGSTPVYFNVYYDYKLD